MTDHTKSHPADQGRPLVSLGQGDYRKDIMPGDVSKGHTRREEAKALDALTRDAMRSGTVPLADSTPPAGQDATVGTDAPKRSVLPTLTPITTQVRKLEIDPPKKSASRLKAEASVDQCEARLRESHLDDLLELAAVMAAAELRGEGVTLSGRPLSVARSAIACIGHRLFCANEDAQGGAS